MVSMTMWKRCLGVFDFPLLVQPDSQIIQFIQPEVRAGLARLPSWISFLPSWGWSGWTVMKCHGQGLSQISAAVNPNPVPPLMPMCLLLSLVTPLSAIAEKKQTLKNKKESSYWLLHLHELPLPRQQRHREKLHVKQKRRCHMVP